MRYLSGIKFATVAAMLSASAAWADEELPVPAPDYIYCTVCHGVQLMGNQIIKAPRLSGMETWYVEQQLKNFKNGLRGRHDQDPYGYEMQPMAAALSDEQIAEVAIFVNATRSPAPPVTVTGDVEKGKIAYTACAACHGADGEGNEALRSPNLTVMNDWYILTQLKNYKNGSRGSQPGDTYGMQMRAAVQLLADDAAMADVVGYISTLKSK